MAGELDRMASIWRQSGVLMAYFRICALKKWGQVFTRVGLLVNLYSVTIVMNSYVQNLLRKSSVMYGHVCIRWEYIWYPSKLIQVHQSAKCGFVILNKFCLLKIWMQNILLNFQRFVAQPLHQKASGTERWRYNKKFYK